MKHILSLALLILIFASCSKEEEYGATSIHTIPFGEEGTLSEGDYSGDGAVTNVAGTTVTIEGKVTVDAFSASGKIYVPEGATLIVNSVMTVGGGAVLDIHGTLITQSYTQIGNTYMTNGILGVSGKFTVGGGTTLYLENSEVEAGEFVIVGHVKAISNDETMAANYYSIIEAIGVKYLNRGGGTTVCGPILFTMHEDQGASGVNMSNVTSAALGNNSAVQSAYGLSTSTTLYQYDDTCPALAEMPAH